MDKTKIDFIIDLLNDKRLDGHHKEKLFSLAHKELKTLTINDEIILSKLDTLEKQLSNSIYQKEASNSISSTSNAEIKHQNLKPLISLPKYIDPRNTAKFLNDYNQNFILKSTTHDIDENLLENLLDELNLEQYSYETHMNKIDTEFQNLASKYFINKGLMGKLKEYLFSTMDKGWSEEKIRIGWTSQEVANWCSDNSGKCPNAGSDLGYPGCSLEEIIELKDGSFLKTFNEVVGKFKGQIEFRDDSDLKKVIQKVNSFFFSDYLINIDEIKEGIRFYSDVEKVAQAYKNIIKMCLEHWEKTPNLNQTKPNFTISLTELRTNHETKIIFSIKQINSIFGKTALAQTERYGNSLSGLILNQINGLCDLVLKAEFPDKSFSEIKIWPIDKEIKNLESFTGVQFDLIFYRLS